LPDKKPFRAREISSPQIVRRRRHGGLAASSGGRYLKAAVLVGVASSHSIRARAGAAKARFTAMAQHSSPIPHGPSSAAGRAREGHEAHDEKVRKDRGLSAANRVACMAGLRALAKEVSASLRRARSLFDRACLMGRLHPLPHTWRVNADPRGFPPQARRGARRAAAVVGRLRSSALRYYAQLDHIRQSNAYGRGV
jgi:hypothetical protein